MARFKRTLWGDSEPEIAGKELLLVAVALWLRQSELNLSNLIRFTVPYSRELKLGQGIPSLPSGIWVLTDGTVQKMDAGTPGRLLWCSSSVRAELDLDLYEAGHLQYSVHWNWIEWALFHALVLAAGTQHRLNITQPATVGGMELAEFLL